MSTALVTPEPSATAPHLEGRTAPGTTSPLNLRPSSVVDPAALADVLAAARENAPSADVEAAFPTAVMDRLRTTRLLGLVVPTRYGGPGGTVDDVLAVSHALSRECTSSGMIFAMHSQQVEAVVRYGPPRLAERLLPRIARGEVYLASVTTEVGNGGYLLSAGEAVENLGDTLRVQRMAPVVTGGEYADGYLISMRADTEAAQNQVSLVYADAQDLTAEPLGGWNPLGMRATRSVPMRFDGAVPHGNVIGGSGRFREIVTETFGPLAHLGWSACWLGTAAGALARTVAWLRSPAERKRRDMTSDLLRSRLSHIRQRLDLVHALIAHGADVYKTSQSPQAAPYQLLMNAVKLTASQECLAAVNDLIELAGMRHGYLKNSELGLERAVRDLRSAALNYSNDRLHAVDGAMALLDSEVRFV
ncbi:acyl-CoA dehydrogenase family protein [Streptomyces sp. NPDC004296]|uniref:acyl-CoA dehydrogenase family protein n=1 Tax=Streptomyces sp. NPDC004296 TaxID=3364697 RepID=UPI00369240F6